MRNRSDHQLCNFRRPTGAGSLLPWSWAGLARGKRWRALLGLLVSPLRVHTPPWPRGRRVRDLVQEYFTRLLQGRVLAAADPAKGRFRTFLIADCVRFLSHQRARDKAVKRGGNQHFLSIDAARAEGRYALEAADWLPPDRLFLRAWALTLLAEVLAKVRRVRRRRPGRSF